MRKIDITYYYIDQEDFWVDIPNNTVTNKHRYNIGTYQVKIAHFSELDEMINFLVDREVNKVLDFTFANENAANKQALKLNQDMIKEYSKIITNSFDSYN